MNRLERLYAITEELRRYAPASRSAQALADRFGVARRTIERDLAALRAADVAIGGDVGRGGGYTLQSTFGRVVVSLSPEEVVAILLSVRASKGAPFSVAASVATQRLRDALPPATQVSVDVLRSRVMVTEGETFAVRPTVQRTTEAAVRGRFVMRITYVDANEVATTREVEAHGFYGAVDGWYLIAWCRMRNAGRLFRLDRIARATLTKKVAPARVLDDVLGWVPKPTTTP